MGACGGIAAGCDGTGRETGMGTEGDADGSIDEVAERRGTEG